MPSAMTRSSTPGAASTSSGVAMKDATAEYARVRSGSARLAAKSALLDQPPLVVGPVWGAGDVGVDLGEPVPVVPERRAVQRLDGLGGQLVEAAGELVVVGRVGLAQQVAQQSGVDERDRRAPAERRVGARPGVAHRDHAGGDRVAVDDEATVPVLDAGHHVDIGDRLAVCPVRDERVPGDSRVPSGRLAQHPQRLVPAAGRQHHAPGVVVGGQREYRQRVVALQEVIEHDRLLARTRAEMPAVVDESAVRPLLDRTPRADRLQPRAERRPPATAVDYQVGGDRGAVFGEHSGHPRHPPVPVRGQAGDGDTAPDGYPGGLSCGRQSCFEYRAAGGHGFESLVAVPHGAAPRDRQCPHQVQMQRTGGLQRVPDLRQLGPQLLPTNEEA